MTADRSWGFARRPIWLTGHVLVIVTVVVFANLGAWQLRRHDERRALNALIEARQEAPTTDLASVLGREPADLEFSRVRVSGRYDPSREVILAAQTFRGVSGHRVLTPLVLDKPVAAGSSIAVIVDRGWVPIELDRPGGAEFAPPSDDVAVVGVVRRSQTTGRRIPAEGVLEQIGRVDIARLDTQMPYDLAPWFLHLVEPGPPQGIELPLVVPPPAPESGPPHLAYAVQWFVFAAIAAFGYALLLRRTAQTEAETSASG